MMHRRTELTKHRFPRLTSPRARTLEPWTRPSPDAGPIARSLASDDGLTRLLPLRLFTEEDDAGAEAGRLVVETDAGLIAEGGGRRRAAHDEGGALGLGGAGVGVGTEDSDASVRGVDGVVVGGVEAGGAVDDVEAVSSSVEERGEEGAVERGTLA